MIDPFSRIEEVKTTLPTQAAAKELAVALVDLRLAACVQVSGPIDSFYRWQGEVKHDQEFGLSCKTSSSRLTALLDHLKANHPYELPELIITARLASPEYAQWVNSQVDVISS